MSPRVITQHAKHGSKTEEEIVRNLCYRLSDLRAGLSAEDYMYLETLSRGSSVYLRSVEPGKDGRNAKKWGEIEAGDVALVAWKGEFRAVGRVLMRKKSQEIAGLVESSTKFEYFYFLRELDPISIPYPKINKILRHAEDNNFQRFNIMSDEQSSKVVSFLETHVTVPRWTAFGT